MPLYDFLCADCGKLSEILVTGSADRPLCSSCGGIHLKKMLSVSSSLSGVQSNRMPAAGDTACCGSNPSSAGCAGPGSCCGKR